MIAEEIDMEDRQKFLNSDMSDPLSVRLSDPQDIKISFNGLSKEEVMKYGKDPTWVRVRWFLFIVFWLSWIGMLAAAIIIVTVSKKCPYKPKLEFWEKDPIYQVDLVNFHENQSGYIQGLMDKLDYFDEIGIKNLCLKENILDEKDLKSIRRDRNETIAHFKQLRKKMAEHKMHLIIDIPLEKLSNQEDILSFWLKDYADGVRVVETNQGNNASQVNKLIEETKKISKKVFSSKYISFYPYSFDTIKSHVINTSLLNLSPETLKNTSLFLSKIDEIGKNEQSFILGYYGEKRISENFSDNRLLKIAHGILLLIRGTPFLMYGDELELKGSNVKMSWTKVESALASGAGLTLPRLYKKMLQLRQNPSFSWGEMKVEKNQTANVISFVREADRAVGYLVIANVNDKQEATPVNYQQKYNIPQHGKVEFFYSIDKDNHDFEYNNTVQMNNLLVRFGELLIVRFNEPEE